MGISFGQDVLNDFEAASQREWLETNGIGGFASGTLSGASTRRYHGLLVAATLPPLGRMVLVSKLEERVSVGESAYDLSANQYPGAVHPQGHLHLVSFDLDPNPSWTFRCGPIAVKKSVMMIHGQNTTLVDYQILEAPGPVFLSIKPFLACRDYHWLIRENRDAMTEAAVQPGLVTLQPYPAVAAVHIGHPRGRFTCAPTWYRNLIYQRERERGLEFCEDLLCPGVLELKVEPDYCATIVVSTKALRTTVADDLRTQELSRRRAIPRLKADRAPGPVMPFFTEPGAGESAEWTSRDESTEEFFSRRPARSAGARRTAPRAVPADEAGSPLLHYLRKAADSFIVRRGNGGRTVIAGYHWFGDWGRDTMISLPGLTLACGLRDLARETLETFSRYLDQGLLPNCFPDGGAAPEYNTVDASLWFAYAAEKYLDDSRDKEFARKVVLPTIRAIIEGYREGTRYNIRVGDDGLIGQGQVGVALTWMDARVGDWVVTPRRGKPVEVNALWHNALGFAADLEDWLDGPREARELRALQTRVRESFVSQFWFGQGGYLCDVVDGIQRDLSVRPNQIFALSLPRALLDSPRARSVLEVVERELYTPLGLRSLSPVDPAFRPRFAGNIASRDSAYHQGTVWAYLIGPYLTAYLNVHGRTPTTLNRVRELLVPFTLHLQEAGLGSISEVFDGEAPHRPGGCISQAWSVAELLRVIHEELGDHL